MRKSAQFLWTKGLGFTLIELLVVIAVLAVLAAGVIVAINPGKRIRQANDAKIKNDVGQLATALQAYYTTNQLYPAQLSDLTASEDIKQVPAGPGGTCPSYTYNRSAGCSVTSCEAQVNCQLQDPNTLLGPTTYWCWQSATGRAVEQVAACAP